MDMNNRVFVKHVKSLFHPEILNNLREKINIIAANQEQKEITSREHEAVARGESADGTRMKADWYSVWQHSTSRKMLFDHIGPFTYVIYPVQVRHVTKAYTHEVPWHQDIAYIRLLGKRSHYQVITCFVPLEKEPAKCTTLQFAFDNLTEKDKVYDHIPMAGFGAGIQNVNFRELKHFDLQLGDALIFGDHTLHRTYLPEGCQIERRSLEFRLICPQHAIADKDYYNIENGTFIYLNDKKTITASSI